MCPEAWWLRWHGNAPEADAMERLRAGSLAHRRIGARDRPAGHDRRHPAGAINRPDRRRAAALRARDGRPTGARTRKMNVLVLLLAAGAAAYIVLGWPQT